MKYVVALTGVFLVIWCASVFLGAQAKALIMDPELGLIVPKEGSSVMRLTEGGACSHYAQHGLNEFVASRALGNSKFFLLHGDSHIEAFQVPDESKPDAVLSRYLKGKAVAYGTGQSGYGFASMIVRAKEYERVMGIPIAHVFFTEMGLEDDVLGDGMDEVRRTEKGFVRKAKKMSSRDMLVRTLLNKTYLNFLIWRPTIEHLHLLPRWDKPSPADGGNKSRKEKLVSELVFVLDDMKCNLKAPSVIVYGRRIPSMSQGGIVSRVGDDDGEVALLERLTAERGIGFLDVRGAALGLYEKRGLFANGFVNSHGPGSGHLNEMGIDAIFSAVAAYLRERYGL